MDTNEDQQNLKRLALIPVVVSVLTAIIFSICVVGCGSDGKRKADDAVNGGNVSEPPGNGATETDWKSNLTLNLGALPDTNNLAQQPDWDLFAWNSFVAMNWPAIDPATTKNYLRGFPNTTSGTNFVNAKASDLTVWETYKEKREVFNHTEAEGAKMTWNAKPDYGPIRKADGGSLPGGDDTRLFHGGSKFTYDSFDETTEVLSESLEEFYQDGTTKNPVMGQAVAPRVWQKIGSGETAQYYPVVYEVKVNYDFFDYVMQNEFYIPNVNPDDPSERNPNSKIYKAAENGQVRLPYRTNASSTLGPASSATHNLRLDYSAENDFNNVFKQVTTQTQTYDQPPPRTGAVHLKAAWIMLYNPNKKGTTEPLVAHPERFHQATGAYFLSKGGKVVQQSAIFGLAGLHIIQRIHNATPGDKFGPGGGTFIFASWEHTDVDDIDFVYSNYFNGGNELGPKAGWYPNDLSKAYVVKRMPINPIISQDSATAPGTQQVNSYVQGQIRMANADSVWQYYQLIGTQFQALDSTQVSTATDTRYPITAYDPTGIGQPAFMANVLLETNQGLQHFMGIPPETVPISNYKITSNTSLEFDRDSPNMGWAQKRGGGLYNMGGCMGCHGVSQIRGYSFSFVLLGGYRGEATQTQSAL